MLTFCVPSHKFIEQGHRKKQSVLLTPDMINAGIWFCADGYSLIKSDEYSATIVLQRSRNEAEYLAALRALVKIFPTLKSLQAVISIRWCSQTFRLVTPKRVWLSIFFRQRELLSYGQVRDSKGELESLYDFTEVWGKPLTDQTAWEYRLSEEIYQAIGNS